MIDQKGFWDGRHRQGEHDEYRNKPSEFALSIVEELKPGSRLLELGCGNGADADHFSQAGIEVTATDFSDAVIETNKNLVSGVEFATVDMTETLPFADGSFDVVYANLSLHYFDDETTKRIITEIHRVLAEKGRLFFCCKSTDSKYEKEGAKEVSPNIFVKNGHLRHLFSLEYNEELLKEGFTIDKNRNAARGAYDYDDAYFVECWGTKK